MDYALFIFIYFRSPESLTLQPTTPVKAGEFASLEECRAAIKVSGAYRPGSDEFRNDDLVQFACVKQR